MDSDLISEAHHWTYHVDFWFPDGNIVVLAGDQPAITSPSTHYQDSNSWSFSSTAVELTSPSANLPPSSTQPQCGITAFRLHRGVLARASSIWANKLDYATELLDTSEEGTHDSQRNWSEFLFGRNYRDAGGSGSPRMRNAPCEVLRLDDDPVDVAHVVRALYDGLYFYEESHTPIARFCILSSVLRLTHKYKIHNLFDAALDCLHADWPATLRDWDRREEVLETERERLRDEAILDGNYGNGDTPEAEEGQFPRIHSDWKWDIHPHPIHVIKLARELGLSGVLLSAFYEVARLRPSEILRRADPLWLPEDTGVLMNFQDFVNERNGQGETSSRREPGHSMDEEPNGDGNSMVRLDRTDLLLVLTAKERLKGFLSDFIRIVIDKRMIAEQCDKVNSERCRQAFRGLSEFLLRRVVGAATENPYNEDELEANEVLGALSAAMTGGYLASDPLTVLRLAEDELVKLCEPTDEVVDILRPSARGACESCRVEFCAEVAQARERCWEFMHHWFGLQQVMMDGVDWEHDGDGGFEHEEVEE